MRMFGKSEGKKNLGVPASETSPPPPSRFPLYI
jgi:hypothetical protein